MGPVHLDGQDPDGNQQGARLYSEAVWLVGFWAKHFSQNGFTTYEAANLFHFQK